MTPPFAREWRCQLGTWSPRFYTYASFRWRMRLLSSYEAVGVLDELRAQWRIAKFYVTAFYAAGNLTSILKGLSLIRKIWIRLITRDREEPVEDPLFLNLGDWETLGRRRPVSRPRPQSPAAESPATGGVRAHETLGGRAARDRRSERRRTPRAEETVSVSWPQCAPCGETPVRWPLSENGPPPPNRPMLRMHRACSNRTSPDVFLNPQSRA